jgi:hypothetical protein
MVAEASSQLLRSMSAKALERRIFRYLGRILSQDDHDLSCVRSISAQDAAMGCRLQVLRREGVEEIVARLYLVIVSTVCCTEVTHVEELLSFWQHASGTLRAEPSMYRCRGDTGLRRRYFRFWRKPAAAPSPGHAPSRPPSWFVAMPPGTSTNDASPRDFLVPRTFWNQPLPLQDLGSRSL